MDLVSLRDIKFAYSRTGVSPVRTAGWELNIDNLDIEEGQILGIIGPNGAGKTTLLKIIGLLEKPCEGEISLWGQGINNGTSRLRFRRDISFVFQEPLLYNRSVYENVAIGLKIRGFPRGKIESKVNEWLDRFNIRHLACRRPTELSGGEAQRVSLARALCLEPKLFLMDEPFSRLDMPTKEALITDLKEILYNRCTAVFVTQDRNEALMFCNRLLVLEDGKVIQHGRTMEVFHNPISKSVADFLGTKNYPKKNYFSKLLTNNQYMIY